MKLKKVVEFEKDLRQIGFNIGKYIYLLDAYEDLEKDYKKGRYNPFIGYIDRREELKVRVDKLISMTLGMVGCGSSSGSKSNSSKDSKTITVWAWDENFNIKAAKEAAEIYKGID